MVCAGHVVEGVGLAQAVAELQVDRQRAVVHAGRGRVLAAHAVDAADLEDRAGLAAAVAESLEQCQGLLVHASRAREVAGVEPCPGHVVEGVGLALVVTEVPVDRQRPLIEIGRGRVIAHHVADTAQVPEGVGLAPAVAAAVRGLCRGAVQGGGLRPQPLLDEEGRECGRSRKSARSHDRDHVIPQVGVVRPCGVEV